MHCLPVRRGVAVTDRHSRRPAQRRDQGSAQPAVRADGRAIPHDEGLERHDQPTQHERTHDRHHGAAPCAAVFARLQAQGVRPESGRRRIRHARGHARADGADRHPAPGRHPRRRRARRRTAIDGARETLGAHDANGRGPARHGRADARSLDDGAERRDQHAHRGRLPRARHSGDRLERRRRRARQSDEAPARASRPVKPSTTVSSATSWGSTRASWSSSSTTTSCRS